MNNALHKPTRWLRAIIVLLCLMSVGTVTVLAQDPTPVPLTLGENRPGTISEVSPVAAFMLTVSQPQNVQIQVLSLTPGLTLNFRVTDAAGVPVQGVLNTGTQTILQAAVPLSTPGIYGIQVESATGLPGQFVLSVQAGTPLQPPQPLVLGQPVDSAVDPQNSRRVYMFSGAANDLLLLTIRNTAPGTGPIVSLKDATTGETLGMMNARLAGVQFRIASGIGNYFVEIAHSGAPTPELYSICLETESGVTTCPRALVAAPTLIPTATATLIPTETPRPGFTPVFIPPGGPCSVASASGVNINVRSGPSTSYTVLRQLSVNTTAQVIGRLADNTWYQVNVGGTIGWLSASVVTIGGVCSGVPVVAAPTAIVPTAPTATSTATTTTATATSTLTATPSETPTATLTVAPVATLNFSLPSVYGSTALTSGFVPDPFTVGVTAGGPANVSYLGGGCSGYTTSAPSFSVNYTSGAFPTLRFYFVGGGDTTMIINTPGANYVCVDDSFGTVDPTIDFNAPSSGRYDVWIGTFAPGGSVSGTLYVTENTNNHP